MNTKEEKLATVKLIASLALAGGPGSSANSIAKELGISPYVVTKLRKTHEYKLLIQTMSNEAVEEAKFKVKSRIGALADKAIKALEDALDDGSIEAVKVAFKALGLDHREESDKSDTNITVILPSSPKDIKSDVVIEKEEK